MTETVRVYINARGVDVPSSATALEAVEAWDPTVARAVASGERSIADSRGLPADPKSSVHNGAIFRIVRSRDAVTNDPDETVIG